MNNFALKTVAAVDAGFNILICQQVATCRKWLLLCFDEHPDRALLCQLLDCFSFLKAWSACPGTCVFVFCLLYYELFIILDRL